MARIFSGLSKGEPLRSMFDMLLSIALCVALAAWLCPAPAFAGDSLSAGEIAQTDSGETQVDVNETQGENEQPRDCSEQPEDLCPMGASAAGYVWPLRSAGSITQYFTANHGGIDIGMPLGSDVIASMGGVVKYVQHYNARTSDSSSMISYGNLVILYHPNGTTTYYAHMRDISVSQGQQISQGQVIGHVGLTGNTSGYHLHFELRTGATAAQNLSGQGTRQNPLNYVNSGNLYDGGSSGRNPVGCLDTAVGGDGTVSVTGWAFDPDNSSASIDIHVYVGGDTVSGEGHAGIVANLPRADVNRVYGISGNHGFNATFNTGRRGTIDVNAYGINVGGGSNAKLSYTKSAKVTYPPEGYIDGAIGLPGTVKVSGWALDRDYPDRNLEVHVYVGDAAPRGECHEGIIANGVRSDVNRALGVRGNHGFEATIQTSKTGKVPIYAYAINPVNGQVNSQLTKVITVDVGDSVAMQRLYNPNSGEHFYTANVAEKNNLVRLGWRYEGEGWRAPAGGDDVFRLYNPNAGDHHYTVSAVERDSLVRAGWKYEGVGWKSAFGGGVPLYRQYNRNAKAGSHNYTVNKAENDMLVRVGWRAEGVGWYGV